MMMELLTATTTFQTTTNLPWAINIPEDFDYPFEYVDITLAYTNFALVFIQ